jgi:hypothetical protein
MAAPRSGVHGELTALNVVFGAGILDETLGQFSAFPRGDHPAGDVTAEDVEDDVEIEVSPLGRAEQLGDVPAPELIGRGGQQFGFLVGRVGELVAALARFTPLGE